MRKRYNCFVALLILALFPGCAGDSSGGNDGDARAPTDAQTEDATNHDTAQSSSPDETWLYGKWAVDAGATREGWGDQREEMERKMVDEMDMTLEFKDDQTVTMTKNGRSMDGMWEYQANDGDAVMIQWYGKEEGSRRLDITMTFSGKNEFLLQSAEVNGEDRLILVREEE